MDAPLYSLQTFISIRPWDCFPILKNGDINTPLDMLKKLNEIMNVNLFVERVIHLAAIIFITDFWKY